MAAKNKTVKAWAILSRERKGKVALGAIDMCYKIFPAEEVAEMEGLLTKGRIEVIIPCTITYKIPAPNN